MQVGGAKKNQLFWLIAVVIASVTAVRTGLNLVRLIQTGEQLKEAQLVLDKARVVNEELKIKLNVVQSQEYQEKEARERLGYGKPGEVVVVLPAQALSSKSENLNSKQEPNWKKWWRLYIGL